MAIHRPILLTFIILAAAWVLSAYLAKLPPGLLSATVYFPFLTALVALSLALGFHRSRIALLIILTTGFYWFVLEQYQQPWFMGAITITVLLVPVNVALFAFFRERGLLSTQSFLLVIFWLVQLGIAYWIVQRHYGLIDIVAQTTLFQPITWLNSQFGQLLGVWSITWLLVSLVVAIRSTSWLESGIFVVLLQVILFFHYPGSTNQNLMLFSFMPLSLMGAILLDSYSMAYMDELTGLPSRRALRENLNKLSGRYTLAMLDVDNFKKFTDTYGHDIGDQVLRFVGSKMRKIGGGGKVYRYGGEEFTFLFPGKDIETVLPHLEKVREDIAHSGFALRNKDRPVIEPKGARGNSKKEKYVVVTASIGVAENMDGDTADDVLKAADDALYRAKEGGRNRVNQ
ncbi:MAG: GGDEF domain-containing protein [Gammaproteobacteria bacterium]|nr:GGDEF domain-containing protein [Gammaproteobacteria bacterium]